MGALLNSIRPIYRMPSILIIEDDTTLRSALEGIIARVDHRVRRRAWGQCGLAFAPSGGSRGRLKSGRARGNWGQLISCRQLRAIADHEPLHGRFQQTHAGLGAGEQEAMESLIVEPQCLAS